MTFTPLAVLMKSFIDSQSGYCPLVWMSHGTGMNNKQIFHAFLFNIRNYSPEVTKRSGVEYYITEGE